MNHAHACPTGGNYERHVNYVKCFGEEECLVDEDFGVYCLGENIAWGAGIVTNLAPIFGIYRL